MPGPAHIDRDTAASTSMPGSSSRRPPADASITESPTALIWSPVTPAAASFASSWLGIRVR